MKCKKLMRIYSWVKKNIREMKKMEKPDLKRQELNIDTFGEIMDEFIKKNMVQMLITLPEGTLEPVLEDNTGCGVAVQFYILLAAMGTAVEELISLGLDPDQKESFIDGCLGLVKESLMKEGKEEE